MGPLLLRSLAHALSLSLDRRLKAALVVSGAVALLHLVPLFLPRQSPEVDLRLAHVLTDSAARGKHLRGLLDNPQTTAVHLYEAARLVLPADPKLAREFLAEADARGPIDSERRLLEAQVCHAEGNATCLEEALSHARALLPEDPRPDLVAADLAERDGDPERALQALSRAHEKDSADRDVTLRYARALGVAGRLNEALAVLGRIEQDLGLAQALEERGLLKVSGGDLVGAIADLEAAAEAAPRSGRVRYFLGVARYRLHDWPRAEAALRESARLDGSDWRPLALLCALQREDQRLEDALVTRSLLVARFRGHQREYERACPP